MEIENNRDLIHTHLEIIDWTNELRINRDLSTGSLLKKVHQLINFWAPIKKCPIERKKCKINRGSLKTFTKALHKDVPN